MAAPLLESSDCTESGVNALDETPDIAYPAYVSGDLIVLHLANDDGAPVQTKPSSGPNGETIVDIVDNHSTGQGGGPRVSAWYFIGTATTTSGTIAASISAGGEAWQATTLKVLAGEFDAITPIDTVTGTAFSNVDTASCLSPAWVTSSSVTEGRAVAWLSRDADPIAAAPAGWSNLTNTDVGLVSGALVTRTAVAGPSESITSEDWNGLSDTYASLGYVINGPAADNIRSRVITDILSVIDGSPIQ